MRIYPELPPVVNPSEYTFEGYSIGMIVETNTTYLLKGVITGIGYTVNDGFRFYVDRINEHYELLNYGYASYILLPDQIVRYIGYCTDIRDIVRLTNP